MSDEQIQAEHELIKKAQYNEAAFAILYDRYFDGVFGFIFRRTDNEEAAGDISSQVFLKVLQNLKKYQFMGLPFSAWLYRIASNEVNKFYRKEKRKVIFSLEEERIHDLIDDDDEENKQHHIKVLVECLNEMSTEVVEVLELRFFEDKGFKEIAFILEISESGAKMRTYRALEKLKKNFNIKIKDHGEA
jgi:RNA polymerase sigma-70 factor (ECF subfamily)